MEQWEQEANNELFQNEEDPIPRGYSPDPVVEFWEEVRREHLAPYPSRPRPKAPLQPSFEENPGDGGLDETSSKRERDSNALPTGPSESEQLKALEYVENFKDADMVENPQLMEDLIVAHNQSEEGRTWKIKKATYGMGLFAQGPQGRNTVVGRYTGQIIPADIADDLPLSYDKVLQHPDPSYSIVGDISDKKNRNYVMFCNDPGFQPIIGARGKTEWIQVEPNAEFVAVGDRVEVILKRPVRAGEEILLNYGFEYWKNSGYGPDKYYKTEKLYNEAKKQYERNQRMKRGRDK